MTGLNHPRPIIRLPLNLQVSYNLISKNMAYNKRQHLADNIAALEWIFMRPEFWLTEEARKVLNGYSGFGGLKCILNPAEKDTDIER